MRRFLGIESPVKACRVEQPREIAQDSLTHLALRHDALLSSLDLLAGLVVGQPVQQRGLKPFLRRTMISHEPRAIR
jgi:hypothetical protein